MLETTCWRLLFPRLQDGPHPVLTSNRIMLPLFPRLEDGPHPVLTSNRIMLKRGVFCFNAEFEDAWLLPLRGLRDQFCQEE